MIELLGPALCAGLLLSLLGGPLGSLLIWRRMAYYGDTLAHGALLGAVAGTLLELPAQPAVISCCLLISFALTWLKRDSLGLDHATLLPILAAGCLSLGLVLASLDEHLRLDLMAYLFGDLLSLDWPDLPALGVLVLAVLGILGWYWRELLSISVQPELAAVEGIPVARREKLLAVLLALTVALAMQMVGVLLITALLVMPAAAARTFARSPEQMAAGASILGILAVFGGISLSANMDAPTGPAIVLAAFGLFLVTQLVVIGNFLPGFRKI